MHRLGVVLTVGLMGVAGCAEQQEAQDGTLSEETTDIMLGPVDGREMPGVDLARVQVGQLAPDFSLVSLAGPTVTLSGFRGVKNVVLVFYRGHW